jgi:hypothetical protein
MKEKWNDLDLKTRIAYVTAVIAFVLGWVLTIAGFIAPPVGIVSDSVLWILGQGLVYAASVLGIGMYVTGSVKTMKRSIGEFMAEEAERYRNKQNNEEIQDD